MEKILGESVIGQEDAVKSVANAIRLSRSGLSNPNRPIASFLMAGPSGTGKTLMAKTVCFLCDYAAWSGMLIYFFPACYTSFRLSRRHDPCRRL
jgi:transcriptional regulator with AAA-type ATPase domain